LGDWGTQFGMLINYIKTYKDELMFNIPSVADLMDFYKKSKKLFDSDPEFKKQSQIEVLKLQSGDEVSIKIWKAIIERSEIEFNDIYNQLSIKNLKTVGESFYNEYLLKTTNNLIDNK